MENPGQTTKVLDPLEQAQEFQKRVGTLRLLMDMAVNPTDFQLNPDDVIIAMPPKNGTTWLTHICHQLRMKGAEPDFEDQLDIMYMFEQSEKLYGVKPENSKQPAKPRLYITHKPYTLLPKMGKRIVCFRDQKDAFVSAYHFLDSLLLLKGRVSLSVFAQVYYLERVENHLNELLVWWEHRHDENVLLIFFDDLKEDHEGCVRRIAEHIGIECDNDTLAKVIHTTTHGEMSRHASKFGAGPVTKLFAEKMCEPLPDGDAVIGRVRKSGGKSGEGKEQLPADIQQRIDQLWQEIVTTKLGFKDMNEIREAWRRQRKEGKD